MFKNQTVHYKTVNPVFLNLCPNPNTKDCVPWNSTHARSKRQLRCFRPPNRATLRRLGLAHPQAPPTVAPTMANPTAIVPYNDPFDDHLRTIENFLMCDDSPTLGGLTDFSCDQNASPSHSFPLLQFGDDIDQSIPDPKNPLSDPLVLSLCKSDRIYDYSQAGPSQVHDEISNVVVEEDMNMDFQNSNVENYLVQTPPNEQHACSTCCQVLREITHTNGTDVTKLEIHGSLGMICHGVYKKYSIESSSNQTNEYQMFDFCTESIGNVKHFLVQYCEERKRSGYVMLQDPLLIFYEALCVGLDWDDNIDTDDFIQSSPTNSGEFVTSQGELMNQAEGESSGARATRSALSAQRERTGKLTLKDFIKYFHFPIEIAAKKMRICPTVMKKICRKHGMTRWPHRKIKSIERKISRRAKSLTSNDVGERAQAQADIEKLRQEIANIYTRFGG